MRGWASASSKRVGKPRTPLPLAQHSAVLNDTPLGKKVSGATPYTSMHYKRNTRMNDLGTEMKGKFVGPISLRSSCRHFCRSKDGNLNDCHGGGKRTSKVWLTRKQRPLCMALWYTLYVVHIYTNLLDCHVHLTSPMPHILPSLDHLPAVSDLREPNST